jgi:hypothetical protein
MEERNFAETILGTSKYKNLREFIYVLCFLYRETSNWLAYVKV